jgi:hypothetical protein
MEDVIMLEVLHTADHISCCIFEDILESWELFNTLFELIAIDETVIGDVVTIVPNEGCKIFDEFMLYVGGGCVVFTEEVFSEEDIDLIDEENSPSRSIVCSVDYFLTVFVI